MGDWGRLLGVAIILLADISKHYPAVRAFLTPIFESDLHRRYSGGSLILEIALFLALFASSHGVLATYDAEALDEGEEAVLVDIVGAGIATTEL